MKTTKMLGRFGNGCRNLVPNGLKSAMFLVLGVAMLPMAAEAADKVYLSNGTSYTRLEYLQSTGSQYIDTGIAAKSGTKARIDFSLTSIPSDGGILAARNGTGDTRFYLAYYYGGLIYGYGVLSSAAGSLSANTRYVLESTLEEDNQYVGCAPYAGGTKISRSGAESTTYNYAKTLHLFGANNAGNSAYRVSMKLYGCKIWQKDANGVYQLFRDFVPAKDNSAGTDLTRYGLYDKVEGRFYICGNSNAFGYGEIFCGADDYVVTEAGTRTLESPFIKGGGGLLANYVDECVFDQRSYPSTPEYANSFTGFVAGENSRTTFLGGWWDFGGGVFPVEAIAYERAITLAGSASATNVCECCLAGTSGSGNMLSVKGSSALYTSNFVLGRSTSSGQNSHVEVADGGLLSVSTNLLLSCGTASSNFRYNTGNRLVVSNASSRVVVAGTLGIGNIPTESYGGNPLGGNQVHVTDNALLTASTVSVGSGSRCFDNRLVVNRGGKILCDVLNVNADYHDAKVNQWLAGDGVYVTDGGVLSNSTTTTVGYPSTSSKGSGGVELVVSNGVFFTGSLRFAYGKGATNCTVRLSGPYTEFTIGDANDGGGTRPFGTGEHEKRCEWIFENGVVWNWPAKWQRISYSSAIANCAVIVRTGAKIIGKVGLTCENGLQTKDLLFSIQSEACVTGTSFYVGNLRNCLSVFNATLDVTSDRDYADMTSADSEGSALTVGGPVKYAGAASNDLCVVCGDHPRINAHQGGIGVYNWSRFRFELPNAGYADGCIPVRCAKTFRIKEGCSLEVVGSEAFAKHQRGVRQAQQTLVRAKSIDIAEDVLTVARTGLPKGVSLELRSAPDGINMDLVLKTTLFGLTIMVR